jgi:integrase/recombinase XerC
MAHINDGIVSRHLDFMSRQGLSPLTIQGRRCALERLSLFLAGPVLYASPERLEAWQTAQTARLAPATRRTELSSVRAFYRWAVQENYIAADPTLRLPMPRCPRRMPRPIPDHRLSVALNNADDQTRAILGLAAFAGLRAVEVARLNWADVTLDGPEPSLLVARGKGDRSRHLPLSPILVGLLSALPHRRGPVIPRADGATGNNSANAITKRAARHLKSCGIAERLHAGRHRFASAAYQGTLDIRAVQELLGHSSPTTTAIYAKPANGAALTATLAAGLLAA